MPFRSVTVQAINIYFFCNWSSSSGIFFNYKWNAILSNAYMTPHIGWLNALNQSKQTTIAKTGLPAPMYFHYMFVHSEIILKTHSQFHKEFYLQNAAKKDYQPSGQWHLEVFQTKPYLTLSPFGTCPEAKLQSQEVAQRLLGDRWVHPLHTQLLELSPRPAAFSLCVLAQGSFLLLRMPSHGFNL